MSREFRDEPLAGCFELLFDEAVAHQGHREGDDREEMVGYLRAARDRVLDALPLEHAWPKACSCGRSHDEEAWGALPFVGVQDDGDGLLELRDCPCRSTLSVPLASAPRALDVVTRALLEHRRMLAALREVQARCTALKSELRGLRAEREKAARDLDLDDLERAIRCDADRRGLQPEDQLELIAKVRLLIGDERA